MTQTFRTLDSTDIRVDLNVPMEHGTVSDATRVARVLPTIREIASAGEGDPRELSP